MPYIRHTHLFSPINIFLPFIYNHLFYCDVNRNNPAKAFHNLMNMRYKRAFSVHNSNEIAQAKSFAL